MKGFVFKIAFIMSIFVVAIMVHAQPIEISEKKIYDLGCRKNANGSIDVENVVMGSFDKRIEIEDKKVIQIVSYFTDEDCKTLNRIHYRIGIIMPAEFQSGLRPMKNPRAIFTDFILIKNGVLAAQAENLLMVEKMDSRMIDSLPADVVKIGATLNSPIYYTSEPLPAWLAESNQLFLNDQGTQLQLMGTNYILRTK